MQQTYPINQAHENQCVGFIEECCETFFFYCGKNYYKYKKDLGNAHPA
jgi:hypothetical protein